ncbi:APC family permease [Streptomyces sp. NBC_01142]|uniref:APC family permease n=1 Tax=Streptomyces sp. NBC_01142 TaxID=2975865 RepID=UPI002251C928|nr:APC family permease [Streptomyces sp. NBC_01142]MCX4825854.1 APC family permease [Streptomyces sp. NBC_01142]
MSRHGRQGGSRLEKNGLRANALGAADAVVMAVAGSAPAYTLAAATAVLTGAAGLASPAALLSCAIPMVGIVLAFKYLGRLDVNAGASYSWVGRALHPGLGFLSGWALVVSATLFMVAGALPAGSYTLSLFSDSWAQNGTLAAAVGAFWFLLMAALVVKGARISARAQWVMTGIEVAILLVVGVAVLVRGGGAAVFSWSWLFDVTSLGGPEGFAGVALIAAFYFWGWDVTANLSEETSDSRRVSGLGGLLGVVSVLAVFEVVTIAVNLVMSQGDIQRSSGTVLADLGDALWPGWGGKAMVIAVMLSTIATLETTLIQVTRTLFAMGRDRTLPAVFGLTHRRWQTPWAAVTAVAAVALTLLFASSTLGPVNTVLADAFSAIGLQICVYYSLAGVSVVVAYRRLLLKSVANAVFMGLWPLFGAVFMMWAFYQSLLSLDVTVLVIGLGSLAAGVFPFAWYVIADSEYYTGRHARLDASVADRVESQYGDVTAAMPGQHTGRVSDL